MAAQERWRQAGWQVVPIKWVRVQGMNQMGSHQTPRGWHHHCHKRRRRRCSLALVNSVCQRLAQAVLKPGVGIRPRHHLRRLGAIPRLPLTADALHQAAGDGAAAAVRGLLRRRRQDLPLHLLSADQPRRPAPRAAAAAVRVRVLVSAQLRPEAALDRVGTTPASIVGMGG